MTLFSKKRHSGFSPKYKRQKVTSNCTYPPHWGDPALHIDARSTANSEVGEEAKIVPVKISRNSVQGDMECETTKPLVSNANVEAVREWVRVENDIEVLVKKPKQTKPNDVLPENLTEAEPVSILDVSKFLHPTYPCARKYPPPKTRKGVTTRRDFPSCFGKRNATTESDKVSGNKRTMEQMQLVDTTGRAYGEQIGVPIQDGNDYEKLVERNALKEMMDEVHADSMHLITKYIEDGRTSENGVRQENSFLLQNHDTTGNSQELSLTLSAEPDIPCVDTLFEDKERENSILVGEEPNVSVVPFVKIQDDASRGKVMETLNLFRETFTKLRQQSQAKMKGKNSGSIYLEAAKLLKQQQKRVNTEKLLGPVPGVEIGDKFQLRAELVVIGLHHQFQSGIDYVERNGKILATSIVDSGRYGNKAESSDVLIYSGEGGNPKVVDKPPEDQKLKRGNLALKTSMDGGIPVRVILKTKNTSRTTFTYGGLYMVTKCRQERWEYGKLVYKFELNRLAGQPKLSGLNVAMPKKTKGLKLPSVVDDISKGKEEKPVRVVNIVDDEKPPPFGYITNVMYPEWYESNCSVPNGCDCINGFSDFEQCPCTIRYGGDIPFTLEGSIVRTKPLVYECGPSYKCHSSCQNRVSQNGIRYHLEIFKTEKMGWGVRSLDFIQSGGYICEYTGELLREQEAEKRVGNDEYLFDVGKDAGGGFTIDAGKFGNVGRFINHSCSPNLYAQNVLYDHEDESIPHIMFFATRNIPPFKELTYDYNYKVDKVLDSNGNIKRKICYCGSRVCSGRLY